MNKYTLIFGMLIFFTSSVIGQNLDLLWKAKALQSIERVDSLTKIKSISQYQRFQIMLESGYMSMINPSIKDIVIKKANGLITYHVIMNFAADTGSVDLMDVAYQYEIKTESFFGVRVDHLPKKWGVRPDMPGKLSGYMMITNLFDSTAPGFIFNKSNPFDYQVVK